MDLMDYRRKIIANSPHLMSASGAVATFSDGADLPLESLLVNIEPVQSGTGDPSPDNVRPISGWNGVKVTRCGNNLFDKSVFADYSNWLHPINTSGFGTDDNNRGCFLPKLKANTSYTISFDWDTTFPTYLYLCKVNADGVGTRVAYLTTNNIASKKITFTIAEGEKAFLRMGSTANATVFNANFAKFGNCMLEEGSSATPYEPYNGVTIRCGKNLLQLPTLAEINNADLVMSYRSIPIQLAPNTRYYLSTTFLNGYTANGKGMYGLITANPSDNSNWVAFAHSGRTDGKMDGMVTTNSDGLLYIRFNGATEQRLSDLYANSQIQLEEGSTATDYEPYTETFYGGTLNPLTGVMTVDKAMVDLGMLNWTRINTQSPHWRFWALVTGMLKDSTMMSNQYAQITPSAQWTGAIGITTQLISGTPAVMVTDERYETAADFKTAMSGVQLVYELATPYEIQLTPQQIRSLYGNNTIFADTGNVALEYWVHP